MKSLWKILSDENVQLVAMLLLTVVAIIILIATSDLSDMPLYSI